MDSTTVKLNETGELEECTDDKKIGHFKELRPQIFAALVVAFGFATCGNVIAFTAILFPQLEKNGDIALSIDQKSWIASIICVMGLPGAFISSMLVEKIGKLNTLKVAAVLSIIGWIVMALSTSFATIFSSRLISGLSLGMLLTPPMVYIAEIARKDIRGSLLSLNVLFGISGLTVTYLKAWLLDWRIIAWSSIIDVVIHLVGLFFIPESPIWLITNNKHEQGHTALLWLNKYNEKKDISLQQMEEIKAANNERRKYGGSQTYKKFRLFLKPTGYKPAFIVITLLIVQQFSGIFMFLFYAITFFEEAGTKVNPYMASVAIGVVRLITTLLTIWMAKIFNRRTLMVCSTAGTGVAILVSGLFTYWIKNGTSDKTWVPLVCITVYTVCATIGPISLTFNLAAEVFPSEIRDIAVSLTMCLYNVFMFIAVYNFANLCKVLNGLAGVQWFFAGVAAFGVIFNILFLPETHNITLPEIEDYFRHNTIYLTRKKPEDVVKAGHEQSAFLKT